MKRIVSTLMMSLALIPAVAQQRTMEEMENIAHSAFVQMDNASNGTNARRRTQQHKDMIAIPSQSIASAGTMGQIEDAFYVFKSAKAEEAGFVIVSTDLAQRPVLAYSSEGCFDQDNIPDNVAHWLRSYVVESEQLRSGEIRKANYKGYSGAVSPLVTANWDQDAPYYNLCPTYNGRRCVTGCTATGIAQVMNYHKHPANPTGSVNYSTDTYGMPVSANLASYTLNWDNMLDTYSNGNYNSAQSDAVATLMYTVGAALLSDYTPGNTSVVTSQMLPVLTESFKYDIDALHCQKVLMSHSDWIDLLVGELNASRPVIYSGQTGAGGHCFVVDGYEVSDDVPLFHINWGWGGFCDGYFYISNLNPQGSGIGGSAGAYQYNNTALINLHPENGVQDDITSAFGVGKITPSPENLDVNGSKQVVLSIKELINLQKRTFNGYLNIYIADESGTETFLRAIPCERLTFWNKLSANILVNLPEDIKPGLYYIRAKTQDAISNREQIVVMPEDATVMIANFDNDTYTWFTYAVTSDSTVAVTGTNKNFNQTELVIPETVIYRNREYTVTAIGDNAFRNYSSPITSISIPQTVRTIGQAAFAGCQHVTSLVIPEGVETFGADCFNDMTGLRTLSLPSTIKSLPGSDHINTAHMGTMTSLESVTISPDNAKFCSIDGVLYTKGMEAIIKYPANKSDTTFNVPMGVQIVLNHSFRSCRQLRDIILPPSVNHIGAFAFDNDYYISPSIRNVYITSLAVPEEKSVTAFVQAHRITLHVPEASLKYYTGKSPWTSFAAIEGYGTPDANENIAIRTGWNWVSHHLSSPLSTDVLMDESVYQVLTQTREMIHDPVFGFVGNLRDVEAASMMKIYALGDAEIVLEGDNFDPSVTSISLAKGWNWLGYPLSKHMYIKDALSLLAAGENDCIVGQSGFATFSNGEWRGELHALMAGSGYMYFSASAKVFKYSTDGDIVSGTEARARTTTQFGGRMVDIHKYRDIMCLTTELYINNVKADAARFTLLALHDDECRGISTNVDGVYCMSVHGDEQVPLRLVAIDNETGEQHDISESLSFCSSIVGTFSQPYALHIAEPTLVRSISTGNTQREIYSATGVRLPSMFSGFNIVRLPDGTVRKVFVK